MSPGKSGLSGEKQSAQSVVAREATRLVELSHRIHAHPELGFEEVQAAAWCAEALAAGGFDVRPRRRRPRHRLRRDDRPRSARHRHLLRVRRAARHRPRLRAQRHRRRRRWSRDWRSRRSTDPLGLTVHVLGTPAEEGGGGKILLLDAGVFDGLCAALMVHPAPAELVQMPCLAIAHFDVRFVGKEAHASAFPELGVNAADAVTIAQVAVGLLRQHAKPGDQVHGIVTNGGSAPNIVPGLAEAKFYVRSATLAGLAQWEPRVRRCFEAGALATGASVEFISRCPAYSEFRSDAAIEAALPCQRRVARSHVPAAPATPADGVDRHGERLARHPGDPPDARHPCRTGGQPSTGVRGALRDAGRRPGHPRWRDGDGLDGHRSRPRRERTASADPLGTSTGLMRRLTGLGGAVGPAGGS